MADTKISGLAAATSALGADEIPVNEAGTSKKLTVTQLTAFEQFNQLQAPGSFTVPTGAFALFLRRLTLTGAQRATANGTGIIGVMS